MKRILRLISGLLFLAPFHPLAGAELGDAASPLQIAEWIKGEPVDVRDGKNIYVIEFWATWCPPCRTSIPHLTGLQMKFKDQKIIVLGISDEKAATVKPFVEKMGKQMNYRVALDKDGKTTEAYLKAFGINGIPHAFVIDKAGKIVWSGHPMAELEDTLRLLLEGKHNVQTEKTKAEGRKLLEEYFDLAVSGKSEERMKELEPKIAKLDEASGGLMPDGKKFNPAEIRKQGQFSRLMKQYEAALLKEKDEAKAAKLLEEIGPVAPAGIKVQELKHDILLQNDFGEYFQVARSLGGKEKAAEITKKMAATECSNPVILNEVAWAMLTAEGLKFRDAAVACKLARKAVDVTEGKNEDIVDTYARALFESGQVREAVAQQKKALDLCKPGEKRLIFEKTLEKYQAAAKEKQK